jgi:hypothetical protein
MQVELVISDREGNVIRRFTRKPEKVQTEDKAPLGDDDRKLTASAGLNSFVWDMRYPSVTRFEKLVLWNDDLNGPKAVPGTYRATLKIGNGEGQSVDLEIRPDPRLNTSAADLRAQFAFTWGINRKLTETHESITRLRATRAQLDALEKRIQSQDDYAALTEAAEALKDQLTAIEEALYQTKLEARQDPLNFPIRLNDKLAGVMFAASFGDHAPTASAIAVRDELVAAIDMELARLATVLGSDLAAFNEQAASYDLPAVAVTD